MWYCSSRDSGGSGNIVTLSVDSVKKYLKLNKKGIRIKELKLRLKLRKGPSEPGYANVIEEKPNPLRR